MRQGGGRPTASPLRPTVPQSPCGRYNARRHQREKAKRRQELPAVSFPLAQVASWISARHQLRPGKHKHTMALADLHAPRQRQRRRTPQGHLRLLPPNAIAFPLPSKFGAAQDDEHAPFVGGASGDVEMHFLSSAHDDDEEEDEDDDGRVLLYPCSRRVADNPALSVATACMGVVALALNLRLWTGGCASRGWRSFSAGGSGPPQHSHDDAPRVPRRKNRTRGGLVPPRRLSRRGPPGDRGGR